MASSGNWSALALQILVHLDHPMPGTEPEMV
jgi:hypothetical protein